MQGLTIKRAISRPLLAVRPQFDLFPLAIRETGEGHGQGTSPVGGVPLADVLWGCSTRCPR